MSSSYKQSKKDIAEPDQFLKTANGYVNKAANNLPKVIAVSGGILAVVLVCTILSGIFASKKQASGESLSAAVELTRRPVSNAIGADAVQAFADEKTKNEAVIAAFEKVRQEHAGTMAAISAICYMADANFKLGRHDQALTLYSEYLSKASKDSPLYLQALEGKAYTLEAKSDFAQAHSIFLKISDESKGDMAKARAEYNAARMLELQGKEADAANAYAKIEKKFDKKAYGIAQSAKDRLAKLAAKGIKPAQESEEANK